MGFKQLAGTSKGACAVSSLTHVARKNLKIRAEQGKVSRQRLSGPVYPGRPSWGWGGGAVLKPNVGRQLSVNQSHTSYVLRGYLFWGVKLTYTINRQEGSLVAGARSKHRNQEPEPRGPIPDMFLFLKDKYTMPQWAGISAAIG